MTDFDPTKQYRSSIIRGRSLNDLDNLLPVYVKIIQEICPCPKSDFDSKFNSYLELKIKANEKTLNNHRTEIAGKLFGLYFMTEDKIVYLSERALKLLEDEDQPAFFKDICFKFQFPNGMDSIVTIKNKMSHKVSIRQFSFILELLTIANDKNINLTKLEIAFFVLNSLEVLQGNVTPDKVLQELIEYRDSGREISFPTGSRSMQHINEQLSLLVLANLIRIDINNKVIFLNFKEQESIDYIRSFWNVELEFDAYNYSPDRLQKLRFDWQIYYSKINKAEVDIFSTSIEAIQFSIETKKEETVETKPKGIDKIALGDDGENYVYNYEKERVGKYDGRLTNKVLLLGKTRGLGYDIQSIIADGSEKSEFTQYIEVKATKRTTEPSAGNDGWIDAINLTRNEWIAAEQHMKSFSLYRVYFTPEKVIVYIINNPFEKNINGSVKCTPISYRMDFSNDSVDTRF